MLRWWNFIWMIWGEILRQFLPKQCKGKKKKTLDRIFSCSQAGIQYTEPHQPGLGRVFICFHQPILAYCQNNHYSNLWNEFKSLILFLPYDSWFFSEAWNPAPWDWPTSLSHHTKPTVTSFHYHNCRIVLQCAVCSSLDSYISLT